MGIRMTGINSGLDTDAIVEALVSAQSLKVTKVQNKLTKSEWTQEIWKDLNTKLYSLYTGPLTKMKTQGSYNTKKVSSSDSTICTATATGSAANGSHTLQVNSLASSQMVTSGKINASSDSVTLTSLGMTEGAVIKITAGTKTSEFTVKANSDISDFVSALKDAGLNANFDTSQKRLFISSANSGKENSFSITTKTNSSDASQKAMKEDLYSAASKEYEADCTKINTAISALKNADVSKLEAYLNGSLPVDDADYATIDQSYEEFVSMSGLNDTDARNLLNDAVSTAKDVDATEEEIAAKWATVTDTAIASIQSVDERKAAVDSALTTLSSLSTENLSKMQSSLSLVEQASAEELEKVKQAIADGTVSEDMKSLADAVTFLESDAMKDAVEAYDTLSVKSDKFADNFATYVQDRENDSVVGDQKDQLSFLGLANIDSNTPVDSNSTMSVVWAKDAEIVLDRAVLTDTTNSFSVNGLTLDLKNVTETGKSISLTTSNDTDAVYNMVKDFVKQYNEILDELNTRFNAASANGYDQLTYDEKEALSDVEVEKWENKIKDSLLRKDGTLGSIITVMRQSLLTTTEVNGVKYSLASFGIRTSSDYMERGKLHIYGDEDDDTYATEDNLLKEALESNPEAVMKTFSEAAQNLYDSLQKKMTRTSLSSALTFYNDKQMSSEQSSYKKQISELQDKLTDLEDRYYSKFTAMETALAKLNSQSSYLTSMMGGY